MFDDEMFPEDYFAKKEEEGSLLERFERRRAFLAEVSTKLKQDFVGLNDIIDSFIDKIEAWYVMPESMRRPAIICLWGMTGIGKTDLVRKLIRYLNFGDRYLEIQMTNKGASVSSFKDNIQAKIEMSNLEPNTPGILFLDEMQRYRTKDEKGNAIPDIKDQDIWQLLSDGKFAASTRRMQLYELLFSGLLYDWDARRWGQDPDDEDEKKEEKKKKNAKYKRGYYTAKKLKKLLKLDTEAKEIMTWSDEVKEDKIREALKNEDLFEGDDYSKLLIIISGNIDEAYKMSGNVSDGDIDADVLHEFSKNINFLDIKDALLLRFFPEQIARFGNNHLVYPSLSRKSYEDVIDVTLDKIRSDVIQRHNIIIDFSDKVRSFVYRNGVFPSQGVRPVFSTIYASVENLVPKVIMSSIENDSPQVIVDYNETTKHFEVYKDAERILNVEFAGDIDKIKDETPLDLKMLYVVHEIGHAIIYSHEFGVAPTQIEPNAAGDGAFVGMHTVVKTRKTILSGAAVALAGYAAELLVFGEVTNGARSDLIDATSGIKRMIKSYGMDEFLAAIGNPHVNNVDQGKAHNVQDGFNELETINSYLEDELERVTKLFEGPYRNLLAELSRTLFESQEMSLETYVQICRRHDLEVEILAPEFEIIPKYQKRFEAFVNGVK